ncbi:MAG: hypothetical protein MJ131_11050 [Lachnospiraceae bacterium]|nr:hypothetical protein [Lachnospiraceae bacterium]
MRNNATANNGMRRMLCVLMALVLVLTVCPLLAEKKASAASVIKIHNVDELKKIQEAPDKSYKLVKNIEFKVGEVWEPIGTADKPFIGVFDGAGHTIFGLETNEQLERQGLFGTTDGAVIKNLVIEGEVAGTASVGAFVGYAKNTRVANCINLASVKGINDIGGIVGYMNEGRVYNCQNEGKITCADRACGGIVGFLYTTGSILNCTNVGDIYGGNKYTGGIVGGTIYGDIKNCNNLANIKYKGTLVGGIAGNVNKADYEGVRENNYFFQTNVVNANLKVSGKNCTTYDADLKLKKTVTVGKKSFANALDAMNYWAKKKSGSIKYKKFKNINTKIIFK